MSDISPRVNDVRTSCPHVVDAERIYSKQSTFLVVYTTLATPDWVTRCVEDQLLLAQNRLGAGHPFTDDYWRSVLRRAQEEGFTASRYVASELRTLISSDIALAPGSPLSIVRSAVTYPTQVLREAGVDPVRESQRTTAPSPEDPYGLSPTTLAALHPLLPEVSWRWEAARAAVRRQRGQGER